MTKKSEPEVRANRKSFDDFPVQFWTDGRITLGRNHQYAGKAAKERKHFDEILKWVDTYTLKEIQEMCR